MELLPTTHPDHPTSYGSTVPRGGATPEPPQTPPETRMEPPPPPSQQPEALLNPTANDAWGDFVIVNHPHSFFSVVSKNVSTLNTYSLNMTAIATELQTMDASIFLAQETNMAWKPTTLQAIDSQCNSVFKHKKLATSSSNEKSNHRYQPGGTLTLALGKWASRVISRGHDELLGRWSFLELVGQQNKRIMMISAYRVCNQQFDATSNTVTAQQTRLLQQNGVRTPNPQQQFITDLIELIKSWTQAGKEILLGMDANEDVDNPRSKITRLFTETGLIDLHNHRHPANRKPATHQRGSAPIDIIAGTQLLAEALQLAWILPFGIPALIKGDHRLLGVDFDTDILFGHKPANPAQNLIWGVNSNNEQLVTKFCKDAITQCNLHHLGEHIDRLILTQPFTNTEILELEAIDSTLTKLLTQVDQRCRRTSEFPWSPTVQKAYVRHRYWTIRLAVFRTQRNLKSSIDSLAA